MVIGEVQSEFRRYREIGEMALAQIPDDKLNEVFAPDGNSAAMIVRHLSGNLVSRFTDFLTTDGEKPWRNRDDEFEARIYHREQVIWLWNRGWAALDGQLQRFCSPTSPERSAYEISH